MLVESLQERWRLLGLKRLFQVHMFNRILGHDLSDDAVHVWTMQERRHLLHLSRHVQVHLHFDVDWNHVHDASSMRFIAMQERRHLRRLGNHIQVHVCSGLLRRGLLNYAMLVSTVP